VMYRYFIGFYLAGESTQNGGLNFFPIFEGKVSGVSVQDMLLCLPFLNTDT